VNVAVSGGLDMLVEDYSFGRIVIGGKVYSNDVIVSKDWIKPNWWRKEGHRVYLEDIREILERKPEVVVFGTGAYGIVKVEKEVVEELKKRGIEVICEPTAKAVEIYNKLLKEGKNVVLAAHLTC